MQYVLYLLQKVLFQSKSPQGRALLARRNSANFGFPEGQRIFRLTAMYFALQNTQATEGRPYNYR